MKTFAVIGKNFGDEGKGLVSASLCLYLGKNLIIKHNGGAQAGHTVECRYCDARNNRVSQNIVSIDGTRDGGGINVTHDGVDLLRFIHHQIGSGAEFGAATLLAETYYSDLYQLGNECEQFATVYGYLPEMLAEESTPITIIDDVLINMAIESKRGDGRHGSCGMGINECRERLVAGFTITVGDICANSVEWIFDRLMSIRNSHTVARIKELGLVEGYNSTDEVVSGDDNYYATLEMLNDDNVLMNYAEQIKKNVLYLKIIDADRQWLEGFDRIVFESGQGLLLDEFYLRFAPHLTTSRTGIINPVIFLDKRGLSLDEVIYVTRTYVTKHGAGPLPCECRRDELPGVEYDVTNEPNEWQGTIRYARHENYDSFFEALLEDWNGVAGVNNLSDLSVAVARGVAGRPSVSLAVTHLNETNGQIYFADGNVDIDEFENRAVSEFGSMNMKIYKSYIKEPELIG